MYSYAKTIPGEKKFDLEGITLCPSKNGLVFYVVNQSAGDILKVKPKTDLDKTGSFAKMNIDSSDVPDYKNGQGDEGFIGIASDCSNQKLYVAKKNNPNVVFTINLLNSKVEHLHNLDTGNEFNDDISDLFFENGQLYVLQKNRSSILVMDPAKKAVNESLLKRYDYSITGNVTKDSEDFGNADGLVVQDRSIYLFLAPSNFVVQLSI